MRIGADGLQIVIAAALAAACWTATGQTTLVVHPMLPAVSNYYQSVYQIACHLWKEPSGVPRNLKAYCDVRVDRAGHPRGLTLVKSSGNEVMDRAVETALRSIAQFPPMPTEMTNRTEVLHFRFDTSGDGTGLEKGLDRLPPSHPMLSPDQVEVNGDIMTRDDALRRGYLPTPEEIVKRLEWSKARLNPGDVVLVTLNVELSLSHAYTLNSDGSIELGWIGPIALAGLTEQEAATRIRTRLRDFYVEPNARVEIREHRQITGTEKDKK